MPPFYFHTPFFPTISVGQRNDHLYLTRIVFVHCYYLSRETLPLSANPLITPCCACALRHFTLKNVEWCQQVGSGTRVGLEPLVTQRTQSRWPVNVGPRPESVAHTEHEKTGRKCGPDLESIQKCGWAFVKTKRGRNSHSYHGHACPVLLFSPGREDWKLAAVVGPPGKLSSWNNSTEDRNDVLKMASIIQSLQDVIYWSH